MFLLTASNSGRKELHRGQRMVQVRATIYLTYFMFTAYIDDSGTDPKQDVAIAAGIIVPTARLEEFDEKWNVLKRDELIPEFHTSECVAGQKGSLFEKWTSQRKKHLCYRVREITKEFAVKAMSFAVNKSDYDEVIPEDDQIRTAGGGKFHYTWAIRHMVSMLDMWSSTVTMAPFEYIFDSMGRDKRNAAKQEIEMVMAQAESINPGRYEGHYSFKNRKDHPGLQCSDLLAWSSYQISCNAFKGKHLHPIAEDTFWDYEKYHSKTWMFAITIRREDLEDWANRERADIRSQDKRRRWAEVQKRKKAVENGKHPIGLGTISRPAAAE